MRLFIASPVPSNVKRALKTAQDNLMRAGASGRFVPVGNFHITLRFLGESDALLDITSAMKEAVKDVRPMALKLCGYGEFHSGGGRTGHVTIEDARGELFRLNELLVSALSDHGVGGRSERFVPHITLGRGLTEASGAVEIRREAFTVDSIALYESVFKNGQVAYNALHKEVF